ncbi:helix-turn-helix transcriptional regulator [Neorhizobium galegae]|nr:helix-turn-helix transcriptional regulator [Neorhizobium galegae]
MQVLRAARALLGLSQEELAQLSGVSRQIVIRIEKGEANILVDALDKVRKSLEMQGVVFLPASRSHGPGIALGRSPSHPREENATDVADER